MRRTLAAVAALTLLALGACSSTEADGGGDSGGSSDAEVASVPESGSMAYDADAAGGDLAGRADVAREVAPAEKAVISTGEVALRSEDAGRAALDVRQVVARLGGEVEQSNTDTDKAGEVAASLLVVRVPSARFAEAMAALEDAADLVHSSQDSKDVTTQVVDVEVRVRVQRRSIERIAELLDRAESIRDVVSIEAQLARRQADLASLEKQQDVLADQTSMSTITVSVDRVTAKPATAAEDDDAGFLTGLDAGWDALRTFGVGVATFLGAVLPWTLVLLVLAIPGAPLLRWLRRRQASTPAAPAA